MSLNNLVKRLQDIMRNDAGINGDAQRIEQMVWILFLKVYDAKEEIWEFYDENYTSIIPEELRWRNWAVDHKDGKAFTGDALLDFVNGKLFPTLKAIAIDENTPMSQIIVRTAFEDNNNYMKDGILLRQVINVIDEIDFEEYEDRHAFGEIYETILRSLQSAGNSGEFYTPRAVTDFMVQMIKPKLGESIADFACGTGGFLTSALKVLDAQGNEIELKDDDEDTYQPGARDDYYKDDEDFGYDKNSDFASAGGFTFKGDSDDDDLTLELEDSSEEGQLSDEDYE